MSKQNILRFFSLAAAQAAFDGDGNAEAQLNKIKRDLETVPESALNLRDSFEYGHEQEERLTSVMTPEEKEKHFAAKQARFLAEHPEAVAATAVEDPPVNAAPTPEEIAANAPTPGEIAAKNAPTPEEIAAANAPTPEEIAAANAETDGLKKQLKDLKAKNEQLEAEKMAASLAPPESKKGKK